MHERAIQFASEIKKIKGFYVLNEIVFNQVLLCCETDELTTKHHSRVQELRECWAGGSVWNEKSNSHQCLLWATTAADITRSVKSFRQALSEVGGQQDY